MRNLGEGFAGYVWKCTISISVIHFASSAGLLGVASVIDYSLARSLKEMGYIMCIEPKDDNERMISNTVHTYIHTYMIYL